MIYTVTLNPALDYTIHVDHLQLGKVNRTQKEHLFAGGKGINVSWILNELGIKSTALGFVADFTGQQLSAMIEKQGIAADFIHVSKGMTRINVKIKSEQESEINGIGPIIEPDDFHQLCLKIGALKKNDFLVLSGSIPSCMPSDTYEIIMKQLENTGVCIVVDAEKKLLMNTLKYHPFLIKPNKEELEEIFGIQIKNNDQIIDCAKKLQQMGARNVLVSMANQGALLFAENDQIYPMHSADGKMLNSVGAGDSMVAGFLAGWIKTSSYEKALLLGSACGGATAFSYGLADKTLIDEVLTSLAQKAQMNCGGLME